MSRYQPEPKSVIVSVRVTEDVAEMLDVECNLMKVTRSRFVELALLEKLEKRGHAGIAG